jgi:hypothetical protein
VKQTGAFDVPVSESADQIVQRLSDACRNAGLVVEILEPSTRIKVNPPDGNVRMAEIIRLAPNGDEVLMWWWSWGTPICPAGQIERAVDLIAGVVAVRVF